MAQSKYGKYLVTVPIREVGVSLNVKGRTNPTLTYMSNQLVPGCNVYVELAWIYEMPEPNPLVPSVHTHDYDQVALNIGSDPHNPEYLGAEIESYMGGERLIQDKTTALFIPKGVEHGRVSWKRVEKPHIQMTITLGAGNLEQAQPGGRGYSK